MRTGRRLVSVRSRSGPRSVTNRSLTNRRLVSMIATPDFYKISRRSVGDWSATDRGLVVDFAGTCPRLNQPQPGFRTCSKTWLRLIWSQRGPRLLCNLAATDRGPCCDLCDRWKLSVAERLRSQRLRSQSGCNVCLTEVLLKGRLKA